MRERNAFHRSRGNIHASPRGRRAPIRSPRSSGKGAGGATKGVWRARGRVVRPRENVRCGRGFDVPFAIEGSTWSIVRQPAWVTTPLTVPQNGAF